MRIAILGFGLIGGSIARAIRERGPGGPPAHAVTAWSRTPDGPRAALAVGLVDGAPASLGAAIEDAELVVLAAPPLACLELIDEIGPLRGAGLGPDATVTDVASTKRAIVERADAARLRFVGGHPMAGREVSGYEASTADLFVDRPWVVCPGEHATDPDLARVEDLVRACGARSVRIDPADHDAAAAAISHVPLVVSAALVEALTGGSAWPVAATLVASGWRDMTRLARGDPEMGAGIAVTNAAEVGRGLRAVRAMLDAWVDALDAAEPDPEALAARFAEARARIEAP